MCHRDHFRAYPKADSENAPVVSFTVDALRRLSALRLWARHPLKEAIKITEDRGVKLYSTYLDSDGRPAHQTAWENGVADVATLLQNTFALSATEMPLSGKLLEQKRRRQK